MSTDDPPVWERTGPALPALHGDATADVCVVGLGSGGLSALRELRRLGATAAGVDAGSVAAGASGRNGGFLLAGTAWFHHDAVRRLGRQRAAGLYRLTLDEIDRIADDTPAVVRRVGSLRIAASPEEVDDCDRHLAALEADGFAGEAYEGAEGRGILVPTDAAMDPAARCHRLAEAALAAGARLFARSPARLGVPGVVTPNGRVSAERVIVCIDGGLELVVPELAGTVRTARAQMLATAPAPKVALPRPVYARWGWDYWQQLPDGRVALGGCRDHGGDSEWTTDATPTDTVQRHLTTLLRTQLGLQAPITHRWAGLTGFTRDRLPLLGEPRPGVVVAGAYSGHGNVLSVACGRAAARLAVGDAPPRWTELLT